MYPLGVLFGLGFDTATEVGLLGISATQTASGLSVWAILLFPALFTAGMALVDTLDGILMLGAYGWAFIKPVRKLYYNLVITGLSVLVSLLVSDGHPQRPLRHHRLRHHPALHRRLADLGAGLPHERLRPLG